MDEKTLAEAYDLGKARAANEASWYFDGNTPEESIRRILTGIRDGDPEIMDSIGRAPLSGEWADDYGIADLARDFGGEDDSDDLDALADAYEAGYWENISLEVEREAMRWLGESE